MVDIAIHKQIRNAIKKGDLDTVASLFCLDRMRFDWVVEPFGSWLHIAAAHGQLRIVEWLVNEGMAVNQKSGVFKSGPIKEAASGGHAEIVKYLFTQGATLDVDEPACNPLFGAIHGGHTEVAKLLIDSGIDTTVKYNGDNMKDMDALAFAKEWGRSDIVKLLEDKMKMTH